MQRRKLLFLSAPCVAPAVGCSFQDAWVTMVNNTPDSTLGFYIKDISQTDWGTNLLGPSPIETDQSTVVPLMKGGHDLEAIYSNSEPSTRSAMDSSGLDFYTMTIMKENGAQ